MVWLALVLVAADVPFVGCPTTGQQGAEAPRTGRRLTVEGKAASGLAIYQGAYGSTVLAPRGWSCLEVIGSSGSTILVNPQPIPYDDEIHGLKGFGVGYG
jgi:hypothetical protein